MRPLMQTYRVCFADTDAGGIVYHARYLEIAERSRNELLRGAGISLGALVRSARAKRDGAGLVLHRIVAKFNAPAFPDDLLTLHTEIQSHNAARSMWRTAISRDQTPICVIDAELVCINVTTGQAVLIPDFLNKAITGIAHHPTSAETPLSC
jgi:acyl-CoA thioester hydrolase